MERLIHYNGYCQKAVPIFPQEEIPNGDFQTRELKKYYGAGDTLVKALDGVELSVEDGEFVAIIGTSGSGKSTLLHAGRVGPAHLRHGDGGRPGAVHPEGRGADHLPAAEDRLRVQAYNLVPVLSVYENIVLPIQLDGGAVDEKLRQEVIAVLGLEKKLDSLPGQLSGGQQQRVAIARALAAKPAILLADEPTGNLDSRTSQDVLGLMKVTGQKFAQTMVMITHNGEIAQLADRIVPHRGRAHRHAVRGRGYGTSPTGKCVAHPGTAEPAGQPHPQPHRGAGYCADHGALYLLFTIALSINDGFQQNNFRQGGRLLPRRLQIPDRSAV